MPQLESHEYSLRRMIYVLKCNMHFYVFTATCTKEDILWEES